MKTHSRSGITLVELLVAMSLSALVLSAVMGTFLFIIRSSVRITSYYDMERETTRGLEQLGRELRMAEDIVTTGDPITQITLTIPAAVGNGTTTTVYSFNSAAKTLSRTAGDTTEIIVRDIEPGSLEFRRYDLNQDASVTDFDTNQLQITMTIRPTLGSGVASTSKRVVSSRFVLRNR